MFIFNVKSPISTKVMVPSVTVMRPMPFVGGARVSRCAGVHAARGRAARRARPTRAHGVQASRVGRRTPRQGTIRRIFY